MLEISGELIVSGLVKGRITALRLVIADKGRVEGDIVAREVVNIGHMNGRVSSPSVVIEAGAEIEGRIFHTDVTIAKGARVNGRMPWRPTATLKSSTNFRRCVHESVQRQDWRAG